MRPAARNCTRLTARRGVCILIRGARSSAVELRTFNPGVVGSNPTGPSRVTSLPVSYHLALIAVLVGTRWDERLPDPCRRAGLTSEEQASTGQSHNQHEAN